MSRSQGLPLNMIVLGALGVLVLALVAIAVVPSIGAIFSAPGTITNPEFVSECAQICSSLNYVYTEIATADTALNNQFCNHKDSAGHGCQYYTECRIELAGSINTRVVYPDSKDPCTIRAACAGGAIPICFDDSDCGACKQCANAGACNAACSNRANGYDCTGGGDCCSGVCYADGSPPNCDGNCGGGCGTDCCDWVNGEKCCGTPETCTNVKNDKQNCGDCGVKCLHISQGGPCLADEPDENWPWSTSIGPCSEPSSAQYRCNNGRCECWTIGSVWVYPCY